MQHALMNLVITTLFKKYICGAIIKSEHLWVCTKFMHLHIPMSLHKTKYFAYVNYVTNKFSRGYYRVLMLVTEIYIYFVSVESPTHVHLIESWIITSNNNNDDRPPKLKILWISDWRTKRIWFWTNLRFVDKYTYN